MPKVQDLGDQVSADPGADVRVPPARTGRMSAPSTRQERDGRLLAQRGGQRSRHGLPDGRPGDARGGRATRSTRTRSTPGSWAAPSRSPTRTSRPAPGSTRTRPRRRSTPRRPSRSSTRPAGRSARTAIREKNGLKAKIELCTTTRQVRIDTLALVADWLKDVGIEAVVEPGRRDQHLRRLQRVDRGHPVRAPPQQLRPRRARVHVLDRPARQLLQLPLAASSSPEGVNDAQVNDPDIDASLDAVKNSVDFAVIKDAMADFQQALRREDGRGPALLPPERRPAQRRRLGNFVGNPTQAGPTWNAVDWFAKSATEPDPSGSVPERNGSGRPPSGAPSRIQ